MLVLAENKKETLAMLHKYEIDDTWKALKPMFELAIERNSGEFDIDDVHEQLLNQDMVAFVLYRNRDNEILATMTVSIVQYERVKACRIMLLAGFDMKDWAHYINDIERWALNHKCDRIETVCRPGFKKRMERLGFQNKYITLIKPIEEIVRH